MRRSKEELAARRAVPREALTGLGIPRCQTVMKHRGLKQCGQPAVTGTPRCKRHGAHRCLETARIQYLSKFYNRSMRKTLASFVEECIARPPDEQLDLFEELALTRAVAGDAVKMYDAAVELPEGPRKADTMTMAGELMVASLRQVSDMCLRAAQAKAASKEQVSVHALQHVVDRIVMLCHQKLDEKDARKLEQAIREQITLPTNMTGSVQGTTLTPDMDAAAMDDSVPGSGELTEETEDDDEGDGLGDGGGEDDPQAAEP